MQPCVHYSESACKQISEHSPPQFFISEKKNAQSACMLFLRITAAVPSRALHPAGGMCPPLVLPWPDTWPSGASSRQGASQRGVPDHLRLEVGPHVACQQLSVHLVAGGHVEPQPVLVLRASRAGSQVDGRGRHVLLE